MSPAFAVVLPVKYIAIDKPRSVQDADEVAGEKQPQVFVAQFLHLHQLVQTHYHVCEVNAKRDAQPQFEVAAAALGT